MAKRMDPILPIPSILGYWSIILGSFGGPGKSLISMRYSDPLGPGTRPSGPGALRTRAAIEPRGDMESCHAKSEI